MNANLACNLLATVRHGGDRPALRPGEAVVSYAALDDASARVADLLRERGIEPGDRIGLMLPNVPQFAFAYYGVLRAGGVVVPMNVPLKHREVAFHLSDSGAKLLLAWHDFAEAAEAGAARAESTA
jgi:long-chain acyl-CoA synthetase